MKLIKIPFTLFAISVAGFVIACTMMPCNHLAAELQPLSPEEMASVTGASFWFQACDDPDPCPLGGFCISTNCRAIANGTGGYYCSGSNNGCDGDGNYMTCSWAWCLWCSSSGGSARCGTRHYADCVPNLVGGCDCQETTGGSCKHDCS